MKLPEIPKTWLVAGLGVVLVIMRAYGIDSWTTATLGIIAGYITGSHIQQVSGVSTPLNPPSVNLPN